MRRISEGRWKTSFVALLAVSAFAAAGCGSSDSSGGGPSAPGGGSAKGKIGGVDTKLAQPPAEAEIGNPSSGICKGRTYRIGIDIYGTGITFGQDVIDGANATAKRVGCIKPIVLVDNLKPQTVLANAQSFVQQKVDGVVLLNAVAAAQPGTVAVLKRAKIPVVTGVNTAPDTPFIDVDFRAAGVQGGRAAAKELQRKYPDAKPYAILGGFPAGGEALTSRMEGIEEGIRSVYRDLPKANVLTFDGKADPATASQRTVEALGRVPQDAKVITAGMNDDVAYAMLQAVRDKGRDAVGLGVGGDSKAVKMVCNGPFLTNAWFPERSFEYLFPAVIAMANGMSMPERINTPTQVLSAANVKSVYPNITC